MNLKRLFVLPAMVFAMTACSPPAGNEPAVDIEAPEAPTLSPAQAEEAYLWGLPLVVMYRYMNSMKAHELGFNQIIHNRELSEPGQFSGGPNRDTLYSFGWFDLADEPLVISLPDFGDRYFVWQVTDLYTHNFHNVGSHLTEGPVDQYRSGYRFMMASPGWEGEVPEGVELVQSPVRVVNILYRIGIQGAAEYDIVNTLQDETLVLPLSQWKKGVRETVVQAPSNPVPAYRDVVAYGTGVTGEDQRSGEFFEVLEDALAANLPYAPEDRAFVEGTLSELGISSAGEFEFEKLNKADQAIVLDAQQRAFDSMMAEGAKSFGTLINGWLLAPPNHGAWGDAFQDRAYATYIGGMWPQSSNSTYAMAYVDTDGDTLTGVNSYRMKIAADNLPPVTSFWSVSAYDAGTTDLYPNEAGLHNYGSNNPHTDYQEDGSVEIVFSNTRPENLEGANWLPIPEEPAWIILRFYAPRSQVMALEYDIPGIRREATQ